MRDGQYRLLWTGISDSKKMKAIKGEKVFRLGCRLVYTWLLPWCDDDGRMPGHPLKILANVVPNEGFTLIEIQKILTELSRVGLIIWYSPLGPVSHPLQISDDLFIQVLDWDKYQHIRKDRYKSSIYPKFTECQPVDNQTETNGCQSAYLISSPSPLPTPSHNHLDNGFQKFWQIYPKKKSKGDAEKAWDRIKPDEQLVIKMLTTIEALRRSEEWIKEKGKYIPYPATWLNAKGWEDEIGPEEDPYSNFPRIGGNDG
jgi:hypothetical protein